MKQIYRQEITSVSDLVKLLGDINWEGSHSLASGDTLIVEMWKDENHVLRRHPIREDSRGSSQGQTEPECLVQRTPSGNRSTWRSNH